MDLRNYSKQVLNIFQTTTGESLKNPGPEHMMSIMD
jgi:hypothetical protein